MACTGTRVSANAARTAPARSARRSAFACGRSCSRSCRAPASWRRRRRCSPPAPHACRCRGEGPLPARLDVVHDAVGELVDGGLERLGLRHPLLYGDALGLGAGEVSPRASLDVLEDDGVPARLADDPPHDGLVPLDVAPQLVDAQGGQLLALSLAHVEDRPRPKAGEPLFGAFCSPGSSSSFGSFPAGLALTTTGQRILMLYSPLQTCLSSCLSARHDERDALGDESLAPACDVRPRHVVTALP